jgi:hypothetical protein
LRYFPWRASRKLDISLVLKVCPNCLGDLVFRSDFGGDYYRCAQCNIRAVPGLHVDQVTGIRSIDRRPVHDTPPALIPPGIGLG